MPCRSRLALFAVLSAALSAPAMEAQAASAPGGIDTPQGTITLPFSIQDNTETTLTESGLGIGVGTTDPMNLIVSGLVGIGTTGPTAPLDVEGTINTRTSGGMYGAQWTDSSGTFHLDGWDNLELDTGGTPHLFVEGSNGYVGFGTISPSGRIDSETGGANLWADMFNYNSNNPSGCGGVWTYGTSYGVYGQTTGGQAVQGYASSGWGGYFSGGYGVYGQSSGGHYSEFYDNSTGIYELFDYPSNGYWNGLYTNGSMVIGASGGAELCLNGQCTTTLPSALAITYMSEEGNGGPWNLGTHALCVLYTSGCYGNCSQTVEPTSGSPGAYTWQASRAGQANDTGVLCFN